MITSVIAMMLIHQATASMTPATALQAAKHYWLVRQDRSRWVKAAHA